MTALRLETGRARNKYQGQGKFYLDSIRLAKPCFKSNKKLQKDLLNCRIPSDDIRSIDGFEWHHKLGNKGAWSFMVDLNKLKSLGYKF